MRDKNPDILIKALNALFKIIERLNKGSISNDPYVGVARINSAMRVSFFPLSKRLVHFDNIYSVQPGILAYFNHIGRSPLRKLTSQSAGTFSKTLRFTIRSER